MSREDGAVVPGGDDGARVGVVFVCAALMTVGMVMLASVSARLDRAWAQVFTSGRCVRQLIYVGAGICVLVMCARVGPAFLRWRSGRLWQPSVALLGVALLALGAVWAPVVGVASHGRHRWVSVGVVGFQPSEVAKVAVVTFLAAFLTRRGPAGARPSATVPVLVVGVVCALVGVEDFGTAGLLAAVGGLMMAAGGCRLSALLCWSVPALGAFGWLLISQPYRLQRLLAFRDIWADRLGMGYHAIQSLAAIESGGWVGTGLGAGISKFGYLPEAGTDFIFAIICEETGVLGGAVVILLYAALVLLGWRIMRMAPGGDSGFVGLFVFGATLTVALQAAMNIAVVTVVAPTKGIGLPFISAGGSGLFCFCALMGLVAGAGRRAVVASVEPGRAAGAGWCGALVQG